MREPEITFGYPKGTKSEMALWVPSENPLAVTKKNGTGWSCARRLNTDYSGPLIRVRRTYDNTEKNIGCDVGGNLNENELLNFTSAPDIINFVAQSESLNTSPWSKNNTTVTENSIANPVDGLITANLIRDNNTTGAHFVNQSQSSITLALVGRKSYTLRFYTKSNTSTFMNWYLIFGPGFQFCYRYLNFTTGTVTKVNTNWGAPNIITVNALADGWYEIIETFTMPSDNPVDFGLRFYTSTNGTNYLSYSGTSSESFYIWGVQINIGDFATNYIKTTTELSGNGYVTTLYDQFNGRNAVQNAASQQLRIVYGGVIERRSGKPTMSTIAANQFRTFSFPAGDLLRNVDAVSFFSVCEGSASQGYNTQPIIVIYGNTTSTIRFTVNIQVATENMLVRFSNLDGGAITTITGRRRRPLTTLYSVIVDYLSLSGLYKESTVTISNTYGTNGGRTSNTNSTTSYIATYNLAANWDTYITEIIIIPENVSQFRSSIETNITNFYKIERNT